MKPDTEFNRLGDGRQHWCRECFQEYFRARGDLHRQQSMDALRKRRKLLRDYLDGYLRGRPCADCGTRDTRVLEFDHVREKSEDIAVLWRLGRSLEELQREVARCEVVCVNCHRRRTATRGRWLRADPARSADDARSRRLRNVAWLYRYLATAACVDCGEDDLVVLEFDHVTGEKQEAVTNLAWGGYGIETIKREISRCEVRCCNCHRLKTLERRHWAA